MATVKTIVDRIEAFAPLSIQAEFDNSGLVYGYTKREVEKVLLALDFTEEVVSEAEEKGADMIVCHHPPLFQPLKRFDTSEALPRALTEAIRADIAVYAGHTSVDFTDGGLNDTVAELIGLICVGTLSGNPSDPRIGKLKLPMTLKKYAEFVADVLDDDSVRFIGDPNKVIGTAAVVNGSGGGDVAAIKEAFLCGADVFLTAEVKYHVARFTKDNNYAMISFGHYESERCFSDLMTKVLEAVPNLETIRSERETNPYYRR